MATHQPVVDVVAVVATPENTPVPGGGSWCWSDTAPHWLPNTPDQPQPEPAQE